MFEQGNVAAVMCLQCMELSLDMGIPDEAIWRLGVPDEAHHPPTPDAL